jgi:hypothetical protein
MSYFLCLLKLIHEIELIRKPSKANQPPGILLLKVYSGPLLLSGLGTGCAALLCHILNTSRFGRICTGGVPPFPSSPYNNP